MASSEPTDYALQQAAKRGRQQRRRAIIAWTTAVLAVALVAVGAIFGESARQEEVSVHPIPFGYTMTASQYAGLRTGLDEGAFFRQLGKAGLTEAETQEAYVGLFPPHEDDVTCSYWAISDRTGRLARICFDDEGRLIQKLERDVSEESTAVSA